MRKERRRQLLRMWNDLKELNFRTYFIGYYETKENFTNELIIDMSEVNRSIHFYFGKKNKLTNLTVKPRSYNHKRHLKVLRKIVNGRIVDSTKHFFKFEGKVSKQFRLKWAKILQKQTISLVLNPVLKLANIMGSTTSGETFSSAIKLLNQLKKEEN